MIIDSRFADAWARLPDYLGSHVLVSVTALALGLSISLPVAILSARRPLLRGALLAAASVVQTIPGLALLALFYPLLLALSALSERVFGKGFSALGFLPSVLALGVDQLLALMQAGAARRSGLRVALGALGIAAIIAGALVPGFARPHATYVIGAKTFTEQYVLAALIAQRLDAAGLSSSRRQGLGSNVLFDALASGEVDVAVDYSGTLWANFMHRTDVPPREQVLSELSRWLAATHGIRMLGSLGFENAYALAMARTKAQALGIHSIADLARHASELTIAGDYEFFARPEWAAIRDAYGLTFRAQRTMQPDFMYRAAAAGEVDVISAYSSDGQIAKYDLTVLDDPKHVIPPYDAILLLSPRRAHDEKLIAALKPLIAAIPVATMREANLRAASGDTTPDAVARWLGERIEKK